METSPAVLRTVGATVAHCDYLAAKGYASTAQVEPWKTALKRVFETVEGPDYESVDWSTIDLDDYLARFRTLASAGEQYKVESIVAYGRRVRNALEAHAHFLDTGRPKSFRSKVNGGSAGRPETAVKRAAEKAAAGSSPAPKVPSGMLELAYPLGPDRYVKVQYPPNLTKREIGRVVAVMQTLEEQLQLPPGDALAA